MQQLVRYVIEVVLAVVTDIMNELVRHILVVKIQRLVPDGSGYCLAVRADRAYSSVSARLPFGNLVRGASDADHPESPHFRGGRRGDRRCELFRNRDKGMG